MIYKYRQTFLRLIILSKAGNIYHKCYQENANGTKRNGIFRKMEKQRERIKEKQNIEKNLQKLK